MSVELNVETVPSLSHVSRELRPQPETVFTLFSESFF